MPDVLRPCCFAVACVLILGWSAPLAQGAETTTNTPTPTPTISTSYAPVDSEFSLTISPTRVVVGPKDLATQPKLLVVNRGRSAVDVDVQKRDFTGAADGSLTFQKGAQYSASTWVTVAPERFSVPPGGSVTVTARLAVPTAPELGDHQVALVFLVAAGQTEANIRINRGVAAPVYITVPGPTDDSASISDLSTPWFGLGGTMDLTARVRNDGTVHRDFRGQGRLTVDAAGTAAPFPDFTVVRDASRDIATTWDPPLMCVCHPSVSFTNADGRVQTVTARVIVFPLHLLAIVVGAGLGFLLVLRVRRNRRRAGVLAIAPPVPPGAGGARAQA